MIKRSKRTTNAEISGDASSSRFYNQGLASLPLELLEQICQEYEVQPLRVFSGPHGTALTYNEDMLHNAPNSFNVIETAEPPLYSERRRVLKALSQTCHRLRQLALPILWERLEACTSSAKRNLLRDDPSYNKVIYDSFAAQMRILTRYNPQLCQYPRVINVEISTYYTGTFMTQLVQALGILKNVHTVQVYGVTQPMYPRFEKAFSSRQFPGIRSVAIASYGAPLVATCPNLQHYRCIGFDQHRYMLDKLLQHCPKIQSLSYFHSCPYGKKMQRIVENFSELEYISLSLCNLSLTKEELENLRQAKNLKVIRLQVPSEQQLLYKTNAEWQALVEMLKGFLIDKKSEEGDRKYLCIHQLDPRADTEIVQL
ncbi:hypothetical protein BJ165DRAFT_1529615 [Panaeolus papilionaceus]|nr:hypothetical protein BJ165DRAFT_1529615 [Panaeolus papilionaceus]